MARKSEIITDEWLRVLRVPEKKRNVWSTRLIKLCCSLLIVGAVVYLIWRFYGGPAVNQQFSIQVEQVKAESIVQFLSSKYPDKRVLLITEKKTKKNERQLRTILRVYRESKKDDLRFAHAEIPPAAGEDAAMFSTHIDAETFDGLLQSYPDCEIVVSYVGMPKDIGRMSIWEQEHIPKFLIADTLPNTLGRWGDAPVLADYIDQQDIVALIVPRRTTFVLDAKEVPSFDDLFIMVGVGLVNVEELARQGNARRLADVLYWHPNLARKPDGRRRTPLHSAAAHGHTEAAKVLIKAGAKVNARDKDGKTPLDMTKNKSWSIDPENQAKCAELLRNYGARTGAELDSFSPRLRRTGAEARQGK